MNKAQHHDERFRVIITKPDYTSEEDKRHLYDKLTSFCIEYFDTVNIRTEPKYSKTVRK